MVWEGKTSYSLSEKWVYNLTLSLHFVCHLLYTQEPLSGFQTSQHLKALFLHRPTSSLCFCFFLSFFSCLCPAGLIDRSWVRSFRLSFKAKGSRDRSGTDTVTVWSDSVRELLHHWGDLERTLSVKSQTAVLPKSTEQPLHRRETSTLSELKGMKLFCFILVIILKIPWNL